MSGKEKNEQQLVNFHKIISKLNKIQKESVIGIKLKYVKTYSEIYWDLTLQISLLFRHYLFHKQNMTFNFIIKQEQTIVKPLYNGDSIRRNPPYKGKFQ